MTEYWQHEMQCVKKLDLGKLAQMHSFIIQRNLHFISSRKKRFHCYIIYRPFAVNIHANPSLKEIVFSSSSWNSMFGFPLPHF